MADEIESRMEEIRLKNEELEKKHKEVLLDEEIAKQQGAVILKDSTTNKSYEKVHRYDNVELDYDVKDEQKELAKNPDYKPKSESISLHTFLIIHTSTTHKLLLFITFQLSHSQFLFVFHSLYVRRSKTYFGKKAAIGRNSTRSS
jgi:hypothetical protein